MCEGRCAWGTHVCFVEFPTWLTHGKQLGHSEVLPSSLLLILRLHGPLGQATVQCPVAFAQWMVLASLGMET